jgi:hypothetical protein
MTSFGEKIPREFALERSVIESSFPITVDDESNQPVAKAANAIEEDDVYTSSRWARRSTKGPRKNNFTFWDAEPSRLAALLVGHISRYYSLLAPCQTGASTPENANLFLRGP